MTKTEEAKGFFREVVGEDFAEYEGDYPETADMDDEELASFIRYLARVNDPTAYAIPDMQEIYDRYHPSAPCPRCANDRPENSRVLSCNEAQCSVFNMVDGQWKSLKPDVILSGEIDCPYFKAL